MKYEIKREFIETYIIEADSLEQAIAIVDDCNQEPNEVNYGDLIEARELS